MAEEIERRFLVRSSAWRRAVTRRRHLIQCYLTRDSLASVRIRIEDENRAWLTVKGVRCGPSRPEFEYPIPVRDAKELLALAEGIVLEKVRHIVPHAGHDWEVDEFAGENAGLVVAEVELAARDSVVVLPGWVGEEVTDDRRYDNASLVQHPYRSW